MPFSMSRALFLLLSTSHCASQPPAEAPPAAASAETITGTWALPLAKQGGTIERQGDRHTISLRVDQFDDASFNRFGFYDGGGSFEHAYGGDDEGAFIYPFAASAETPRSIEVKARLSAESNSRGKAHETSDVTLRINGVALARQTVRPDDSLGAVYTWTVSDPKQIAAIKLRADASNELRFEVDSKSPNKRGLCIYGRSLDGTAGATPIRISLDLPSSSSR